MPPQLLNLPPEVFPLISVHLPLYLLPRTLAALALASKRAYDLVIPTLYSHLILQNEASALHLIDELLNNPKKGQLTRGLHIRSKLSNDIRNSPSQIDVVEGLHQLIEAGRVPFMHTLELHMEGITRFFGEGLEVSVPAKSFRQSFWKALKENCPRLHTLTLANVGDESDDDSWINECGLFGIEGVSNLTLRFSHGLLDERGNILLLSTIARLSLQLRTLNLAQNSDNDDWMELTPLLSLTFPHLESITLQGQTLNETSTAMEFWTRHPKLECIELIYVDLEMPSSSFDTKDVEERVKGGDFLPKLRHLWAPFADVRALAPLLKQLVSLTVLDTCNAQLPYILRAIVKGGLPNLQSLNVEQYGDPGGNFSDNEGATWWESLEGEFRSEQWERGNKKFTKSVVDDPEWMNSVVLACPNLRELALQTDDIFVSSFTQIIPSLIRLPHLQRFFYRNSMKNVDDLDEEDEAQFISQARAAFEACPSLIEVGDIYAEPPSGYVTAVVEKGEDGGVKDVKVRMGNGMVIGQEHLAFPRSNDRASV